MCVCPCVCVSVPVHACVSVCRCVCLSVCVRSRVIMHASMKTSSRVYIVTHGSGCVCFLLPGVVEVYRVTRRVELGIKATAVCCEKLQQLLKDVSRVWNNLVGFMSLANLVVRASLRMHVDTHTLTHTHTHTFTHTC